jgi:hypothetical protein
VAHWEGKVSYQVKTLWSQGSVARKVVHPYGGSGSGSGSGSSSSSSSSSGSGSIFELQSKNRITTTMSDDY